MDDLILRDVPDFTPSSRERFAVDTYSSAGNRLYASKSLEQRALASTALADERDPLTWLSVEPGGLENRGLTGHNADSLGLKLRAVGLPAERNEPMVVNQERRRPDTHPVTGLQVGVVDVATIHHQPGTAL